MSIAKQLIQSLESDLISDDDSDGTLADTVILSELDLDLVREMWLPNDQQPE